jgi:hypothetical protein
MTTKEMINKIMNEIYALENKRFEILHVRDNKTTGLYEAYIKDEYKDEYLIISEISMSALRNEVKRRLDSAGS